MYFDCFSGVEMDFPRITIGKDTLVIPPADVRGAVCGKVKLTDPFQN